MPAGIWQAPLVWAALAVTLGIVADRLAGVPMAVSVTLAAGALLAWLCCTAGRRPGLPLVYLGLAAVAFGAFYHHYRRDVHGSDDIGLLATEEPRLVRLRGFLDEEPTLRVVSVPQGLQAGPAPESIVAGLCVRQIHQEQDWHAASGRVRITGPGPWPDLHCGDEVEVVGRLVSLPAPANPGEPDWSAYLRDQGFTARLIVRNSPTAAVQLRARGWWSSWRGWLAVLRGWGSGVFRHQLPEKTGGLAAALLLGDTNALPGRDWARYQHTGVIHVLAISGQHLVILAGFLWLLLPRLRMRQRQAAWLVALALLAYALLTGGRPPVMRSAVTVCAACAALTLRRLTLPANLFALAWLAVALLNPMDLFNAGCQLSFLSVAVLTWGVQRLLARSADPLEEVVEASRPAWQHGLRWLGARVRDAYLLNLLIWLAVTPLVAANFHVISISGLWLGPPVVLLTNFALFLGFGLLLVAAVAPPLAPMLAWPLQWCLQACDGLVSFGEGSPASFVSVGDLPAWWLCGFYLGLLAVLTQPPLRRRWRWGLTTGLAWLCLGLLAALPSPRHELRCTFLAVGHGGCTVFELQDGRTLLYDAGSLAGPDVTRRVIAPFLWHRGIRHLDEVFLSHADLDHFNGVFDLLDYFSIGQVSCTPTFAHKPLPGVALTLEKLRRHGTPVRTVKAGDSLLAGDVVLLVLHPPAAGPEGNENTRSLVLEVRHAGHTLLLTGDLEGPGLDHLLRLPRRPIDVLMAPHHGSPRSNVPELADWARPAVVVSSQGPPRGASRRSHPYAAGRTEVLGTWPDGAITITSRPGVLLIETFTTGKRIVLPSSASGNDRE